MLTRGRVGGTATPGGESIKTICKPEMRRNPFSAHHWELPRPLGQAAPGEGQHYQLQGAHTNEQEERDGRGEGGQTEIHEVGGN